MRKAQATGRLNCSEEKQYNKNNSIEKQQNKTNHRKTPASSTAFRENAEKGGPPYERIHV